MITLYTFGPAFGLPDPSPFVTKAEMLLKLADLPYRINTNGFRRAPKGKLPYIEDDGALVPDSTFIRWHIEKKYGFDFDRGLSPAERGSTWAIEKLLEDHLYWAVVDARWMDDENFAKGPANFFRSVPWPMRSLVKIMVRSKVAKALKAHGIGRHTKQEINQLATKDIESIAAILGDKSFLMGSKPCGADATMFAFTSGLLCARFDTSSRSVAQAHPNLVAYADRMLKQYFPDFAGQ